MSAWETAAECENQNVTCVVATIIASNGSSPGKPGFKMSIGKDGSTCGTVGGGGIEAEVIKHALTRMNAEEPAIIEYILHDNGLSEKSGSVHLSMKCNGSVTVLYETVGAKANVVIFGAGHIGTALIEILRLLPFAITVIEPRGLMRIEIETRFEYQISVRCLPYETCIEHEIFLDEDMFVIVTHDHSHDFLLCRDLLRKYPSARYIGVIASHAKAQELRKYLRSELGEDVNLDCLHSPIGLKIGGNRPEEIALSIAAELQLCRAQSNEQ